MNTETIFDIAGFAEAAKEASKAIACLSTREKNKLLEEFALAIEEASAELLTANARDIKAAKARCLSAAMVDRLVLNPDRLDGLQMALREIAALPDPVGSTTAAVRRPNGMTVAKQRIPLGVIAMIYESRPNVTVDAAALCLKAGNAVILRGGSEAFHSNQALAGVLHRVLRSHDLPEAAISLVPVTDRSIMDTLLTLEASIDLVIPRGGESLIRYVSKTSRVPVIKHYKGVCHLYVDAQADPNTAISLLMDGKTTRPGVCNALETLLVHQDIAGSFLPRAGALLKAGGVELRGCAESRRWLPGCGPATDADYEAEFLDLILAIKVVDRFEDALQHIARYGSNHTEVIATNHLANAETFLNQVDASVVMVNASSRFSDGGELGLGAEIGIATTKLHAYGPMGVESLTAEKYVIRGSGQVRHAESAV